MPSAPWKRVKWTLASQVFERTELKPEDIPAGLADAAPAVAFETLVTEKRYAAATDFLAQALPRFEAAAWSGLALDAIAGDPGPAERRALHAVHAWIADPGESLRRDCQAAADALELDSPARYAAFAVFFSGGSIAPDGSPDVEPKHEFAGRFASAAIGLAASLSPDPEAAYGRALDLGASVAAGQIATLLAAA
jgi:hypothetical protein